MHLQYLQVKADHQSNLLQYRCVQTLQSLAHAVMHQKKLFVAGWYTLLMMTARSLSHCSHCEHILHWRSHMHSLLGFLQPLSWAACTYLCAAQSVLVHVLLPPQPSV